MKKVQTNEELVLSGGYQTKFGYFGDSRINQIANKVVISKLFGARAEVNVSGQWMLGNNQFRIVWTVDKLVNSPWHTDFEVGDVISNIQEMLAKKNKERGIYAIETTLMTEGAVREDFNPGSAVKDFGKTIGETVGEALGGLTKALNPILIPVVVVGGVVLFFVAKSKLGGKNA